MFVALQNVVNHLDPLITYADILHVSELWRGAQVTRPHGTLYSVPCVEYNTS